MSLLTAFRLAVFTLAASLILMMLSIVVVKGARALRERRTARLVAQVRPVVLAALDGDDVVPDLLRRRRATVETVAIALLPKLRGEDRDALADLLVRTGIVDEAAAGLSSRSAARRQRSCELLGNAGYRPAHRRLVPLLADRDRDVRITAARALGRMGHEESVGALFGALGERRVPANTASMAVLRIGRGGGDEIVTAIDDRESLVRSTAAELAGSLGLLAAVGRVEELLGDDDATVRIGAARALGRISTPRSTAPLVERLDAVVALGAHRRDEDELIALVTALGRIGHTRAIPSLRACLGLRHRVSHAAGRALTELGVDPTHGGAAALAPTPAAPELVGAPASLGLLAPPDVASLHLADAPSAGPGPTPPGGLAATGGGEAA